MSFKKWKKIFKKKSVKSRSNLVKKWLIGTKVKTRLKVSYRTCQGYAIIIHQQHQSCINVVSLVNSTKFQEHTLPRLHRYVVRTLNWNPAAVSVNQLALNRKKDRALLRIKKFVSFIKVLYFTTHGVLKNIFSFISNELQSCEQECRCLSGFVRNPETKECINVTDCPSCGQNEEIGVCARTCEMNCRTPTLISDCVASVSIFQGFKYTAMTLSWTIWVINTKFYAVP